MEFRSQLKSTDPKAIKDILISTGFFYDAEVEIAVELAIENLSKGEEESGYIFNIAEIDGQPLAYTCYGKTPGTESSYDLYWIAVHQSQRGKGIGNILMDLAVEDIAKRKGQNIWIETASRPLYEPTRQFYLKYGCDIIAELPNFYGENDNKVIFLKKTEGV
jgi:ribosomal protein S18 acetylase RimI-like enzyme